jgi:hypothetical protein
MKQNTLTTYNNAAEIRFHNNRTTIYDTTVGWVVFQFVKFDRDNSPVVFQRQFRGCIVATELHLSDEGAEALHAALTAYLEVRAKNT